VYAKYIHNVNRLTHWNPDFCIMAQVHIGKRIKAIFKESGLKGKDFASRISRDRQVIYNIFKKESIDTGLLFKICKVLDHNFFDYYSHELPMVKDPAKTGYVKKEDLVDSLGKDVASVKKQLFEMEEKYETLRKLNQLQEEKIQRLEKKGKK
jgi:transcriptional regulator with XRE-family HTH domain